MGAGFVILFWSILAGVYSCVFLAFVASCFFGKKKKIAWLKWFGGISAIGMASLALLVAGLIVWGIVCSKNPQWVFKETFKVAPPSSVSKIQSSFYSFADTGSVYLRFETSQDEFEKLISTNLTRKTSEEMKNETPVEIGGDVPKWWDYKVESDCIYYLRLSPTANSTATRGFSNETEYFAYNPKTHLAYYHFIGID
jgi:hypothetical protein